MTTTGAAVSEHRLSIEHDASDVRRVLRLAGEVDAHTAPDLSEAIDMVLAEGAGQEVELDLTGVTFMDSLGMRVVVKLHTELHDGGGKLVVAGVGRTVHRALEYAGLLDHLHVEDPS